MYVYTSSFICFVIISYTSLWNMPRYLGGSQSEAAYVAAYLLYTIAIHTERMYV